MNVSAQGSSLSTGNGAGNTKPETTDDPQEPLRNRRFADDPERIQRDLGHHGQPAVSTS